MLNKIFINNICEKANQIFDGQKFNLKLIQCILEGKSLIERWDLEAHTILLNSNHKEILNSELSNLGKPLAKSLIDSNVNNIWGIQVLYTEEMPLNIGLLFSSNYNPYEKYDHPYDSENYLRHFSLVKF